MILVMLEANTIGYIPTVGYYYRIRKGSITANMNTNKIKEMKDTSLYQKQILMDSKIPASNQKNLWMCDVMMLFRRIYYRESLSQAYVWGVVCKNTLIITCFYYMINIDVKATYRGLKILVFNK